MSVTMDWFEGLAQEIEGESSSRPEVLLSFLEQEIQGDTGDRWTLEGHEPLAAIVEAIDKAIMRKKAGTEISVLAAEQTGKTLVAVGAALQLVADRGRNVGYFLPTGKFAHRFGRTRLKRLIARSPYLSERMRDRAAVNQAALKEFDGNFLYILGLESILDAISIPLDAIVYDEVDHLPEENREWSEGRVAASDLRVLIFVSAGYSPGAGIDLRFQDGTQHRWLVDCHGRGCRRKGICLEEEFPACVAKVNRTWRRVCPDCGTELDIVRDGQWVAKYPSRERDGKVSFRLPSLVIGARDLAHTMKRWEKAQRKKSQRAKFNCAELALPDAGAMQPVTDDALARMESRQAALRLDRSGRERYAGMDTGDLCHLWVEERDEHGRKRVVWLEEIDSDIAEDLVVQRCAQLGVSSLVIDKKPLTTLARAIAYRLGDMVALQDFTESSEMKVVEEQHETNTYRCVKVHRDESLDDFTSEITDERRGLVIPLIESDPVLERLAEHLKNLRKERTLDAKGRAIDRYKKAVANHFGLAGNSARIAELIAPRKIPFEHIPVRSDRVDSRSRRATRGLKRSFLSG